MTQLLRTLALSLLLLAAVMWLTCGYMLFHLPS
jgi:hypothetical protein